jgi:hypothetical protein
MSILTANLKHLYQRRGLWLFHLLWGLFAYLNIQNVVNKPRAGKGEFVISALFMIYLVGVIIAVMQTEILNKPFTYCLPGHRKIVRQFLFLIGIIVSLLYSLFFLKYPGLHLWQLFPVVLSAFSIFLTFYWFAVIFAFSSQNNAAWINILIFGVAFIVIIFNLHIILEGQIVRFPGIFITIGILSSIFSWRWLGKDGLARRFCDKPLLGLFDVWNREKMRKYGQARIAAKGDKKLRTNPKVEEFFLTRMHKCRSFGVGRYIWGSLYTTYGPALSQNKNSLFGLLFILLALCFCGYIGTAATSMLFIFPILMVILIGLPLYSNMLITGGRRERFVTTMTLVVIMTVMMTAAVAILTLVTVMIEPCMPDIVLRGHSFTFQASDLRLSFLLLMLIPIGFIFNLIFYRKLFYRAVFIMLVFMLWAPAMVLVTKESGEIMNSTPVPIIIALCWVIFAVVLHYVCFRWPLVGQGRGA